MFEVSTTSFHTSLKFFQEAQYGFVGRVLCMAAGPISTAELSRAHRCSPAWVEMTCSIQA